jgi:iron-sulfur cluster assembly protein
MTAQPAVRCFISTRSWAACPGATTWIGAKHEPSLTLTKLRPALESRRVRTQPPSHAPRFGVSRTGCSGWGYKVDMARSLAPGDTVFDADGIGIHVDADSLPLVDGTVIDFIKQGLNEQFVFRNPNVAGECGCGESFTTDADKAA